ncbi:MAG: hypothetical protein ACUVRA_06445 [Candidatus Bathyarchaeaceae archaeon]
MVRNGRSKKWGGGYFVLVRASPPPTHENIIYECGEGKVRKIYIIMAFLVFRK